MNGKCLAFLVAVASILGGCAGSPVVEPPPEPVPVATVPESATPPPDAASATAPEGPWAPVLESEAKWIRALKERLPSSWAAYEPDPHVVFLYDRRVQANRIRDMGREVVGLLKDVALPLFPPAESFDRVLLFRVCRDRDQYLVYGGSPDSAGYWSPRDGESVLHEERGARKDALRTLRTIALLQYLDLAGAPGSHPWFRWGVCTVFSEPGARRVPNRHREWAARARSLLRGKGGVPLREFVRMESTAFAGPDQRDNTALAWSLGWFLLQDRGRRWGDILRNYYLAHRDRLASETPSGTAAPPDRRGASEEALVAARAAGLEAAFGSFEAKDWARLERDWKASR